MISLYESILSSTNSGMDSVKINRDYLLSHDFEPFFSPETPNAKYLKYKNVWLRDDKDGILFDTTKDKINVALKIKTVKDLNLFKEWADALADNKKSKAKRILAQLINTLEEDVW